MKEKQSHDSYEFYIPFASVQLGQPIGRSSFKGSYMNKPIFIKRLKLGGKNVDKIIQEFELVAYISHENVVRYKGWTVDPMYEYIYFISPLFEKGNATSLSNVDLLLHCAEHVSKALHYVHEFSNTLHRNIKASSVLSDADGNVIIADFGFGGPEFSVQLLSSASASPLSPFSMLRKLNLSQSTAQDMFNSSYSDLTKQAFWLPPEAVSSGTITKAGDVYSFGCFLFELLFGKPPFAYEVENGELSGKIGLLMEKEKGRKPFYPLTEEQLAVKDPRLVPLFKIMQKCMEHEANKRPSSFELRIEIHSICAKIYRVSKKIAPQSYPTLSKALFARSLIDSNVTIVVEPGVYDDEEEMQIDQPNTMIIGSKGSMVKGRFIIISIDSVTIDGLSFQERKPGEQLFVTILFCSPSVLRCNVKGTLKMLGDETTQPIVCHNVIQNYVVSHQCGGSLENNMFNTINTAPRIDLPLCKDDFNEEDHDINIGICKSVKTLHQGMKDNETHLDLSSHYVTDVTAKLISNFIPKLTHIVWIDLSLNYMSDNGVKYILGVLEDNITVTHIDLSDNDIGPQSSKAIASLLVKNKTLQSLNLSYNSLGNEGVKNISQVLGQNSTLSSLNLSNNKIKVDGLDYLAKGLTFNTSLEQISIRKNDLEEPAILVVIEMLKHLQKNVSLLY